MRRVRFHPALFALVLLAAGLTLAFSAGPPNSETGAPDFGGVPAETNCTLCHAGNALNSGGSINISGIPAAYVPSQVYRLTITLSSSRQVAPSTRWGFELTAARADNGQGVGTFSVVDAVETQIVQGAGVYATRQYVKHKSGGLFAGQPSPQSWEVDWQAPSAAQDGNKIYFAAAGNAANFNFTTSGDWIYTDFDSTNEDITPTVAQTWGSVKARYRR